METVKQALKDFFIIHPICSLQRNKLQLHLDRPYADIMAKELLEHFVDKLNS